MDTNKYYIINRNPIDKSVSHQEGKYMCNDEDGCEKVLNKPNENMTEKLCKIKCAEKDNCHGCHYNNENNECVCYNVNTDFLLEKELDKITKNAINEKNKGKSGFSKKKSIKLIDKETIPKMCNCGN